MQATCRERDSGVVRRDAGIGNWPRSQYRHVHPSRFFAAGRCFRQPALLERRHYRAAVEVSAKGTIQVPTSPGLGYNVKRDLIEKITVRAPIGKTLGLAVSPREQRNRLLR